MIQIIKVNGFLTREESQEKSNIWVFFCKVWRQLHYGSAILIHKGVKKIVLWQPFMDTLGCWKCCSSTYQIYMSLKKYKQTKKKCSWVQNPFIKPLENCVILTIPWAVFSFVMNLCTMVTMGGKAVQKLLNSLMADLYPNLAHSWWMMANPPTWENFYSQIWLSLPRKQVWLSLPLYFPMDDGHFGCSTKFPKLTLTWQRAERK